MAKMKAPDGCTGCSVNGEQYVVRKGYVVVPDDAIVELQHHGFVVEVDEAEAAKAAEAAAALAKAEASGGAEESAIQTR